MARFDMDRATAHEVCGFLRTGVGDLLTSYIDTLAEERKERILGHRGINSIPDVWHDQGFVDGVRAVELLFIHAQEVIDGPAEEEEPQADIPEGEYAGATPVNPRR